MNREKNAHIGLYVSMKSEKNKERHHDGHEHNGKKNRKNIQ